MNEPEAYEVHGAGGDASVSAPAVAAPPAQAEPSDAPEPKRSGYRQLEDVITDESFPEVDLALRRGRHIHKGDERWYDFLNDAQPYLETFYRRYGCELEQRSDGYFFLLPLTDGLGKRHLGVPEMIVGQGLALCFLDPSSVQSGGVITREELLNQLASVMGTDALMQTLNPKRRRADERVMQRTVRLKVAEALRKLAQLGFVELVDAEQLRLWPSLMRFAEPVRGLDAPSEALKRLIERGEVSLGPGDEEPAEAEADAGAESDADADLQPEADVDAPATASGRPAVAAAVTAAVGSESASVAATGAEALAWIEDEPAPGTNKTGEAEADAPVGAESEAGADAEAWAEAAALGDFDAEAEAATLGDFDAEAEATALGDFDAEAAAAPQPYLDAEELEQASEVAAPTGPPPDAPADVDDAPVASSPADLEIEWDTLPGEKA